MWHCEESPKPFSAMFGLASSPLCKTGVWENRGYRAVSLALVGGWKNIWSEKRKIEWERGKKNSPSHTLGRA